MQWVRLDCQAMSHPKLLRAGADAVALWVSGLCHCNTHTTNGRIDVDMVPLLYPPLGMLKAQKAARQLCRVGLWYDRGDHFEVHDYEDFQSEATKDVVEDRREYEKIRKRQQRAAKLRRTGVPGDVPESVPRDVPDNVPDASRTAVPDSPGLSPRAGTRARTPASDRPTDRQFRPTDRTDGVVVALAVPDRGASKSAGLSGDQVDPGLPPPNPPPPPPTSESRGHSQNSTASFDDEDSLETPPLLPCWRLWAIWEQVVGGGPDTCGPRKSHRPALEQAWHSCEKRAPRDPEGLWRRMVEAYVGERRAQGKRIDLAWFCGEFAGWADLVERPNGASSPQPLNGNHVARATRFAAAAPLPPSDRPELQDFPVFVDPRKTEVQK